MIILKLWMMAQVVFASGNTPSAVETSNDKQVVSASASSEIKPDASKSGSAGGKVSTNVNFDDLLIQGKYHFSDEAVITVEQDKALDGLLGVRKDFKDRLVQSASRN